MDALVTIGMPTYNRADSFRRALESAIGQEYRNLQIIVSDNASTDETPALCAEFQARDPRVQYIRQPQNLGAVRNFAAVVEPAAGDYFMWLGDDDWIDPTYVTSCVEILREDPSLALAAGTPRYYEGGTFVHEGRAFPLPSEDRTRRVLEYYRRVGRNSLFYGLIRTPYLRKIKFHNLISWDLYVLAGLAFQGKIALIDTTHIHLEGGGPARTAKARIRHTDSPRILGLSSTLAGLGVACYAFMDIVNGSPAYQSLSVLQRYWLVGVVFWVLFRYKVLRAVPRGFPGASS